MRPGQKNRMRGGRGNNNNNRRGPNPLTRSYESNGPDVKVRGTPQHIAEKYVQLARDAHSSGDTVMAESYLQHAEHYYRIIAAAQAQQQQAYNAANGIPQSEADQIEDEDEFEVAGADRFTFRTPQSFQQPQGGYTGQKRRLRPAAALPAGQSYGGDPGAGRPATRCPRASRWRPRAGSRPSSHSSRAATGRSATAASRIAATAASAASAATGASGTGRVEREPAGQAGGERGPQGERGYGERPAFQPAAATRARRPAATRRAFPPSSPRRRARPDPSPRLSRAAARRAARGGEGGFRRRRRRGGRPGAPDAPSGGEE